MEGRETKSFFNDGFGWACKTCVLKLGNLSPESDQVGSRLFTEGEAETKQPTLSKIAIARWLDPQRNVLCCPLCGIKENVS